MCVYNIYQLYNGIQGIVSLDSSSSPWTVASSLPRRSCRCSSNCGFLQVQIFNAPPSHGQSLPGS